MQLYPDMGVAAMLKNQWPEVSFRIGSLGDRSPIGLDDDVIVLAAPDPQGTCAATRNSAFGHSVIFWKSWTLGNSSPTFRHQWECVSLISSLVQ